jgi:hypothetical protein
MPYLLKKLAICVQVFSELKKVAGIPDLQLEKVPINLSLLLLFFISICTKLGE